MNEWTAEFQPFATELLAGISTPSSDCRYQENYRLTGSHRRQSAENLSIFLSERHLLEVFLKQGYRI